MLYTKEELADMYPCSHVSRNRRKAFRRSWTPPKGSAGVPRYKALPARKNFRSWLVRRANETARKASLGQPQVTW